jgi:hypothetical protein
MHDIPNDELRPQNVPGPNAPWQPTVAEFALTFDGYEAMGGFGRLSSYAQRTYQRWKDDGRLPQDLRQLRSCLFMEQRAARWAEYGAGGPSDEQVEYAHALIDAIRTLVATRADASGPG